MYLLDTHTLLWGLDDDERLPGVVRNILSHEAERVYVSAVSIWEIAIKTKLGKLTMQADLLALLNDYSFNELPVTSEHCWAIRNLPDIHKDPFDRLLIAQTKTESLTLITKDATLHQYKIDTLWDSK